MCKLRIKKFLSEAGLAPQAEAHRQIPSRKYNYWRQKPLRMGHQVSDLTGGLFSAEDRYKEKKKMIPIAVNKPAGIVCTAEKREKNNVIDFLHYPKRIYPVGRLDKESEGLLLLTNNGEIVNKIMRSGNMHRKRISCYREPSGDGCISALDPNGVPLVVLGTDNVWNAG